MAYGGSKEAGALVGRITGGEGLGFMDEDLVALLETGGVEESYRCTTLDGTAAVLTAQISPESGIVEWELQDEAGELRRTVACSQMVSMLHDEDRNATYKSAIAAVIANFREQVGRSPVVLDVGCGTGLLSCMAASSAVEGGGAASVIGCEMFDAMASIAEQVIDDNGLATSVQIIPLKSLDLDLREGQRADVLVSELLDSALLGESVLFTHADAISRLLLHGAGAEGVDGVEVEAGMPPIAHRCVPHSADVFATLVECPELRDMQAVADMPLAAGCQAAGAGATPWRSEQSSQCRGGRSVIPVHWREMKARGQGGRELSAATRILNFEFFHPTLADGDVGDEVSFTTDIPVSVHGTVHGVVSWWTLNLLAPELDTCRACRYSTAPGAQNWQDHWVQVAHLLPAPMVCAEGDVVRVTAFHDSLRIRLECIVVTSGALGCASPANPNLTQTLTLTGCASPAAKRSRLVEGPASLRDEACEAEAQAGAGPEQCLCGWHLLDSPFRLAALNDAPRRGLWDEAVRLVVDLACAAAAASGDGEASASSRAVILDLSDESVLALTAALHVKHKALPKWPLVVSKETKLLSLLHWQQLAAANGCSEELEVWDGQGSLGGFVGSLLCCDGHDASRESGDDAAAEAEAEEEEEGDIDAGGGRAVTVTVAAVICECFYFQMQARPTWAAVSFYYQLAALRRQHGLSTALPVVPAAARLMLVAYELTDLCVSHGRAGCVSGFDHMALDTQLRGWEQYWLPYKLADYRKRQLSEPACVARLDYQLGCVDLLGAGSGKLALTAAGRCDCVGLYVSFELGHGLAEVNPLDAPYYKHNIKFLVDKRRGEVGDVVQWRAAFEAGVDSDFVIDLI